MKREELIEQSIKSGEDRHATRRRLISEGHQSAGFEALYEETLTRLGVAEPRPEAPKRVPSGEVLPGSYVLRARRSFIRQLVVFACVCAALLFALWYAAPSMLEGTLNTIDRLAGVAPSGPATSSEKKYSMSESILKTKVDATYASARLYKGKMLDYQGACSGVSVVAPVACNENTVSLVIYAPLGDGRYYCTDSSGNTGEHVDLSSAIYRCK